jgi:hypothetical protein
MLVARCGADGVYDRLLCCGVDVSSCRGCRAAGNWGRWAGWLRWCGRGRRAWLSAGLVHRAGRGGAGRRSGLAPFVRLQCQGDERGGGGQGDGAAHDRQDGPQRQPRRCHPGRRGWRACGRFGRRGGCRGGRGRQVQQEHADDGQCPAGGGLGPLGVTGGLRLAGLVSHVRSFLAICWPVVWIVAGRPATRAAQRVAVGAVLGLDGVCGEAVGHGANSFFVRERLCLHAHRAGRMLWFARNRLPGSNSRLRRARRWYRASP